MPNVPEISVQDLKARRDKKAPHFLLDVREPHEHDLCRIEGSTLIPMSGLRERLAEIPKDREVVVHCHHGGRSAQVAGYLLQNGWTAVKNLAGGIDAWSADIDPAVARY